MKGPPTYTTSPTRTTVSTFPLDVASQPVAFPVESSTAAMARRVSPPIDVNCPATQSSSPLTDSERTMALAPEAHGSRPPSETRRAASRLRAFPSTVVKAPPRYTVSPSAPGAIDQTPELTGGPHGPIAPLERSTIARLRCVRLSPSENRPPT